MVGQSPTGSATQLGPTPSRTGSGRPVISGAQGGGDLVEQRAHGGIVVETARLEAGQQRPRGRIGRLAALGQLLQQAAERARLGALQRLRDCAASSRGRNEAAPKSPSRASPRPFQRMLWP